MPHWPQLAESVIVSTHDAPHWDMPPVQAA
jgi:hypothetical protein